MLSYESMTERQREFLDRIRIGGAEAQAIAEALKVNTKLTSLNLWSNQLGEAGAQAIAVALKVNKTLTALDLQLNQLGDAGAQAIAEALKVNTTLTWLSLNDNLIGDAGAQAIAEALKVNKTVTLLDLDYNCIGIVGSQAIHEACKDKSGFRRLLHDQINPLAFSLLPRLASAEDIQEVLGMLTSGLELQNQPPSLPALPTEIAELIMDKAHYWQGVQKTYRLWTDERPSSLKVRLPQGDSIRVKAIQVLRDWKRPNNIGDCAFDLTVRDEKGAVHTPTTAKLMPDYHACVCVGCVDEMIARQDKCLICRNIPASHFQGTFNQLRGRPSVVRTV
ncbi:hypothetical protein CAOG_07418 [Capsaspora owczarzaki ATCC 30864]|uniref:hypothetical protein n=1 Tax=Capsaspora owczarzaki (strain ATCC 30864) TaxID=595528 RepID=UPI0001FE59A1|nr:hypothetical protein CAOG_07418 [Capsaspora owczarzaki ATCC 30864]|eukprot:XP_004343277.1 hypothetical protein CAOG_07418 [Capsaspora owczarzaki ATCC 30864]